MKHLGKIHSIQGNIAKVQLMDVVHCTGCQMQGACSLPEIQKNADDFLLEVFIDKSINDKFIKSQWMRPGQTVQVIMKESLGFWAVFFAYVLPLLWILLTLILTSFVTPNEAIIAVAALIAVSLYFVVLYFVQKKLTGFFLRTFSIKLARIKNPVNEYSNDMLNQ